MARLLIEGARLVTMDPEGTIVRADILVEDGLIARIGPPIEGEQADERLDARGLVAIPGFVQTHVHLCQSLFRGLADDLVLKDWLEARIWPFEGALTDDTMSVSADYGLSELLLGGTTTILDMGTVHCTDAVGEAVRRSGMRAFIGKAMMDEGDTIPASLRETREDSIRASLELASHWDGAEGGRIQYAMCPRFAMSCSTELLRDVAEIVASEGFIMHTHANETVWEVEESRRRWSTTNIGHLHDVGLTGPRAVLAHGVHLLDEERRILAETDTCITHCPSSNLKLASGIANIPLLWAAGIRVGLGADGAPCNNNLSAFAEMRLAALIQKPIHGPTAMPAQRVLQMATIDGARVLGLEDTIGSIEVGKDADLVFIDLDKPHCGIGGEAAEALGGSLYAQIVYAAHASDVEHVLTGGRIAVKHGVLTGYDTAELATRGRAALLDVAERLRSPL